MSRTVQLTFHFIVPLASLFSPIPLSDSFSIFIKKLSIGNMVLYSVAEHFGTLKNLHAIIHSFAEVLNLTCK